MDCAFLQRRVSTPTARAQRIAAECVPNVDANIPHHSLRPAEDGDVEVGAFGEVFFADWDVAQYWSVEHAGVIRHKNVRALQIGRGLALHCVVELEEVPGGSRDFALELKIGFLGRVSRATTAKCLIAALMAAVTHAQEPHISQHRNRATRAMAARGREASHRRNATAAGKP